MSLFIWLLKNPFLAEAEVVVLFGIMLIIWSWESLRCISPSLPFLPPKKRRERNNSGCDDYTNKQEHGFSLALHYTCSSFSGPERQPPSAGAEPSPRDCWSRCAACPSTQPPSDSPQDISLFSSWTFFWMLLKNFVFKVIKG